jgi:hypothetical protein
LFERLEKSEDQSEKITAIKKTISEKIKSAYSGVNNLFLSVEKTLSDL